MEDIIVCPECGFKCVRSQCYKTKKKCPKCSIDLVNAGVF